MIDLKTTNLELRRQLTVFTTIVSTLDHRFPERDRSEITWRIWT